MQCASIYSAGAMLVGETHGGNNIQQST